MSTEAILIYGNTCAGKSTLGKIIEVQTGIPYLSFGDLKRGVIQKGTAVGLRVAIQSEAGLPMNPQDAWSIVQPHLSHPIFQLSGFPISSAELGLLLQHSRITGVVFLKLEEDVVRRRYHSRAVCPQCLSPGILGGMCTKHRQALEIREDTNDQEMTRRLNLNRRIESFLGESQIILSYPSLVLDGTLPVDSCASKALDWLGPLIRGT